MADENTMPDPDNVLDENPEDSVFGFQSGRDYPLVPQTKAGFQNLLENPEKPAENQSAPPMEMLNPHLFPERLT